MPNSTNEWNATEREALLREIAELVRSRTALTDDQEAVRLLFKYPGCDWSVDELKAMLREQHQAA